MRKALLVISILVATGTATAEYTIRQALEAQHGGSLPNGSIIFTNQTQEPPAQIENWIATTPLYTDWVNDGEPFNCTNWSPDPSTVALGETFTQTATDCEQQQTRTRQDREQETTTLAVRDVGFPVYENQTIAATDTREAEGTLDPWEAFADARGLSKDWNNLQWGLKGLTEIPISPYPLTSINGNIDLTNNTITNIIGLANVHLSNITGRIYIGTYTGPKLAATTRFCLLNNEYQFSFSSKSQLCESP